MSKFSPHGRDFHLCRTCQSFHFGHTRKTMNTSPQNCQIFLAIPMVALLVRPQYFSRWSSERFSPCFRYRQCWLRATQEPFCDSFNGQTLLTWRQENQHCRSKAGIQSWSRCYRQKDGTHQHWTSSRRSPRKQKTCLSYPKVCLSLQISSHTLIEAFRKGVVAVHFGLKTCFLDAAESLQAGVLIQDDCTTEARTH